jgi:hypothetical protein
VTAIELMVAGDVDNRHWPVREHSDSVCAVWISLARINKSAPGACSMRRSPGNLLERNSRCRPDGVEVAFSGPFVSGATRRRRKIYLWANVYSTRWTRTEASYPSAAAIRMIMKSVGWLFPSSIRLQ